MTSWLDKQYERLEGGWERASVAKKFLIYFAAYTLLFLFLWLFLFSAFTEEGKTYIWTTDAVPQWCTDLVYISKTFREAIQSLLNGDGWTWSLYDFNKGMTERDLRLEPIQLLAVLWPWDKIDELYDLLVVARFYLAGLSFSFLGFYFKQKPLPVLIGALSYTFCQYALYAGIRHPFFMQAMIYLPILIVGIEMVMRREKPFLMIGIVFLVLISNVYWACIQALLAFIYVLVRFPALYDKNRPHEFCLMLGRLVVSAGTGLLLSGVLFTVPLLQNLRTGRVGNSDVLKYTELFSYEEPYYSKFITRFIVDDLGPGSWVRLGFSVLAVPAIALLFVDRKKGRGTLRASFIVLTVMLMFPIVAYVLSGFNAITNRWSFAYAFCVSAIIMFELPAFVNSDKQTFVYAGIIMVAYCMVCRFAADEKFYEEHVLTFLALAVTAIVLCRCLDGRKRNIIFPVCLVITCLSLNFTAHQLFDENGYNYVSEFSDEGAFYPMYAGSLYHSFSKSDTMAEDESFYRVADNQTDRKITNSAFYYGINGTTGYSQWCYKSYDDWTREMEVAQLNSFGVYFGVDVRAPLQSLDSVKYYVLRETEGSVIPYGYRQIEKVKNGKNEDAILENRYALPLGYTYDKYLSRSEYKALSAPEKQEAQLQAAVLDSMPESAEIRAADLEITARQVSAEIAETDNVTWEDGKLNVAENGGTMTLRFDGLPDAETYLRIVGLDVTKGTSTRSLRVDASSGETVSSGVFHADAYLYSNGMKNQILNLGYTEDGYTTCTITFRTKGTYILNDLQIWCQPMDKFAGQIEELRAEPLENVETNWRGLTGTISLSKDKILCVSVPYAEGWTAYVDGEKTEILQVNTAFMGLELEAGEHTVEFKYWTPGLTAGFAMSAAGLAALVWLVLRWRKKPLWTVEKNG